MTTIIILLIYSVLVTICLHLLDTGKAYDTIGIIFIRIVGGPLTWIILLLSLISSKIKKRG